MKNILFLALFLSATIKPAVAQDKHITDSLKHLLTEAKEDTNKVKLYAKLSWQYTWSYPDSALLYATPGLQLAQKLSYLHGQYAIMDVTAETFGVKGSYSKELQTSFQMLKLADKSNDAYAIAVASVDIGNSYSYFGDYKNALPYYYKAKLNADYYTKSQKFILEFIGETYFNLNNLDSALVYVQKSHDLDVRQKNHWPNPYYYLGNIYEKNGSIRRAIPYYKEGINFSSRNLEKSDGYNNLATLYKNEGNLDSSILYATHALSLSLKSSLPSPIITASKILTNLYKFKHLPDSALKYQDIMLAAKDSAFSKEKIQQMENFAFNEQIRQQKILEKEEQYRNYMKMYALLGVVAVFIIIALLLWRNNRHKQTANEQIQKTLAELKTTQTQLIQSEKMASLGELTAGIAHEIQNPLNFVNNFSDVNKELLVEMKEEIDNGKLDEVKAIATNVIDNEEKISHHGKRADAIVKAMLQHSQSGGHKKEPTNINAIADEYVRLSYHGLRSKDKAFNAELVTHFDAAMPKINAIPQDIGRVMLNLFNNAFYAVNQKQKAAGADYKPEVSVTTYAENGHVVIKVKDNGTGIPEDIREKIMQPFFTTKPTGEGTGLGLSLTYDMVVKGHGGSILVNSKEGEGSEFVVTLPVG